MVSDAFQDCFRSSRKSLRISSTSSIPCPESGSFWTPSSIWLAVSFRPSEVRAVIRSLWRLEAGLRLAVDTTGFFRLRTNG